VWRSRCWPTNSPPASARRPATARRGAGGPPSRGDGCSPSGPGTAVISRRRCAP
jgi:hypothetical protein